MTPNIGCGRDPNSRLVTGPETYPPEIKDLIAREAAR
jgi:hypothetical protein